MKTLVIGDSWASAVEADTGRDAGWPEIMGAELRQGVSGSTAAQWASDFDGRLSLARDTDSDAVVISLLGNDARHAVSDGQVTADEIAAGLRDMRAVVEAVLRPLTIVLLYADPFCGTQAQARVGVPLLNGAIRWACNGLPVVFADTGAWLTREHFDGRDIHPTRAGHEVIAAQMLDIISASNAGGQRPPASGGTSEPPCSACFERIFDDGGSLLIEQPYPFGRLFTPGQEQILNSVPMTILSCVKDHNIITTTVRLHKPWPNAPLQVLERSDNNLQAGRSAMIQYHLYAWLMKLAHRHGWHHMQTCYPCGDTMLVCRWCGIRIVTHKATDDDRRKLARGVMPNAQISLERNANRLNPVVRPDWRL